MDFYEFKPEFTMQKFQDRVGKVAHSHSYMTRGLLFFFLLWQNMKASELIDKGVTENISEE